jgi:hypothetical protein
VTWLRRDRGDRAAAAILLLVSALLLVTSVRYDLFTGNAPGPGLFPAIVASILVALSVLWLVTGAGRKAHQAEVTAAEPTPAVVPVGRVAVPAEGAAAAQRHDDAPGLALDEEIAEEDTSIDAAGRRRILFVIAWALVPLMLLERVGYVVTITAYVAGLLVVIARVRPWIAVLGSLVGALLTAVGAEKLGISLPDPWALLRVFGF